MKRLVVSAAAVMFTLAVLPACGTERDYAVPDKLCGIKVDPNLLDSFLPDGAKLVQRPKEFGPHDGAEGCTVYVDGHVVLSSRGEWHSAGYSAKDAAVAPGADLVAGGKHALWERGAATVIPCRAPSEELVSLDPGEGVPEVFSLEIDVTVPDEGTKAAMREFIGPYAEAYRETLPCVEG